VAPHSPGDGLTDILFAVSFSLDRSIDGGNSFAGQPRENLFHQDVHCVAFWPPVPQPGTVPIVYMGCDGGIARSLGYANAGLDYGAVNATRDQTGPYDPNAPAWINMNHGLQNHAMYSYAALESGPAIGYIGCQDTGLQAGDGSLGWRRIVFGDVDR